MEDYVAFFFFYYSLLDLDSFCYNYVFNNVICLHCIASGVVKLLQVKCTSFALDNRSSNEVVVAVCVILLVS